MNPVIQYCEMLQRKKKKIKNMVKNSLPANKRYERPAGSVLDN